MSGARLRSCASILAALAVHAAAARLPPEDAAPPRPLTLRLTDPYVAIETEGDASRTRLPDSPATRDVTADWTPSIGFGLEGSVHHPRLLQFNADVELGITRGERRQEDGAGHTTRDDRSFDVQRYNASLTMLRAKPYSLTVFGRKDREQRNYDQFNRFDVDRELYGAQVRHGGTKLNWDARLSQSVEDVSNADRPTHDEEQLFTLNARYRRTEEDETSLRYSNRDFQRREGEVSGYNGVQQSLYLLDEAHFSADRESRLISTLNLTDINESQFDTRTLTLREDARRRHRENLWEGGSYQYDRRDSGDALSELHNGEIYLEHKFYESIDSRLDLQAERGLSGGEGASDDFLRYGPGVGEHYTKRLREAGRLGIDLEYRIDRITRETSGGSGQVIGEEVKLVDGRPALLSQPGVMRESIVVRDAEGTRAFVEGFDYRIFTRGDFTEIQRVFGGAIPNESVVRVDYAASSSGSDSLYRTDHRAAFELDLYDRLLFLYGDQRATLHFGEESTAYQDHRETTIGIKSRWSCLEVGLERVKYTSDALSYEGPDYYIDLFWDRDATSIKLHAGRSDLTYVDQDGKLDTRTYTATYDWHPLARLSLQAFAGDYQEFTQDGERDMLSFEGRVLLVINRLTVDATYRREEEDSGGEQHDRDYYLLRIKRAL